MVGFCFTIFMSVSHCALWLYENHILRHRPIVREGFRSEFLDSLFNEDEQTCVDQLCMDVRAFRLLCHPL